MVNTEALMHVRLSKICPICKKKFMKQCGRSRKSWAKAKYCSLKCYWKAIKGKMPDNIEMLIKSLPWNKGKRTGLVPKSAYKSGKKHPNWRGGISVINEGQRKTHRYHLWRKKVFKRDRWTCVICGYRSKGNKSGDIVADHIKPFSLFLKLRFVVNNGRTLCIKCDKRYGWKYKGKNE